MSDLIRREDAIEARTEYRNENMLDKEKATYNKGWNDCNDAWVAIIKALPSAEAVQGVWIEKDGELVCSVCGNSVSFSRTPKGWVLGRFCQTCGAKMTTGGDSE